MMHSIVRLTLLSWSGTQVGKKRKKAWLAAPLFFLGVIWHERNRKAFEDVETSDQALKCALLFSLLALVRTHVEGFPLSLIDLVDWLGAK